jgi:hypothetical protein
VLVELYSNPRQFFCSGNLKRGRENRPELRTGRLLTRREWGEGWKLVKNKTQGRTGDTEQAKGSVVLSPCLLHVRGKYNCFSLK